MLLYPLLAVLDAIFWWLYAEIVTTTDEALLAWAALALAFTVFLWAVEEATELALASFTRRAAD